jgi:hypothetical protein
MQNVSLNAFHTLCQEPVPKNRVLDTSIGHRDILLQDIWGLDTPQTQQEDYFQ